MRDGGKNPPWPTAFAESCIPQEKVVEIKDGGRVYWTIWQKQINGTFAQTDSGELLVMTKVPLVRVFIGKKKGTIANKPWSYELCHVALEYYRSLARQTEIENFSGWPMLAAQGVAKGEEEIELGPNTVLFAPPRSKMGNLRSRCCSGRTDRQESRAGVGCLQQAGNGANCSEAWRDCDRCRRR